MRCHQVIDTGLDESSCFFVHDADGGLVPRGYYYDEWGTNFGPLTGNSTSSSSTEDLNISDVAVSSAFSGGDFRAYPDRRKVSGARPRPTSAEGLSPVIDILRG